MGLSRITFQSFCSASRITLDDPAAFGLFIELLSSRDVTNKSGFNSHASATTTIFVSQLVSWFMEWFLFLLFAPRSFSELQASVKPHCNNIHPFENKQIADKSDGCGLAEHAEKDIQSES